MKTCSTCNIELTPENSYFKSRKKEKLQCYCRQCLHKKQMQRWIQRKIWAIEYKGNKCFDCKNSYEYFVYDFHHEKPDEKKYDWNKMRLLAIKKMIEELDKCVLLCSNCHRTRHWAQKDLNFHAISGTRS